MGLVKDPVQEELSQAQRQFEIQLDRLGLSEAKIRSQDLEELHQSLQAVNDAMQHPESFGTVSIASKFDITGIGVDARAEVGILPLLLQRKRLILERIRLLRGEERIEDLRALVDQVADEEMRARLTAELDDLKTESEKLLQQEKEVEQEREDLPDIEWKIKERESRVKMWQAILARESVATIVGAFLLLVFVVALLVAMFVGIETTEIVSSAFLLVLGYFFGQTVSRTQPQE